MAETTKLFTIAGTSLFRGNNTYRFANNSIKARYDVLARSGEHSDINLFELPEPMTKSEAIAWLNSQGIDATMPMTGRAGALTAEQRAAITASAAEASEEMRAQMAAAAEQRAAKAAEIEAADAEFLASLTN